MITDLDEWGWGEGWKWKNLKQTTRHFKRADHQDVGRLLLSPKQFPTKSIATAHSTSIWKKRGGLEDLKDYQEISQEATTGCRSTKFSSTAENMLGNGAAVQSSHSTDHNERHVEQERRLRKQKSKRSPPSKSSADSNVASIAAQNAYLTSELASVRAELAMHKDILQGRITPPSSPPVFHKELPVQNQSPFKKVNRHPSDRACDELAGNQSIEESVSRDAYNEMHESAKGLKNRKHGSPARQHQSLQSPDSVSPRRLLLGGSSSSVRRLPPPDVFLADLDHSHNSAVDLETASFIKRNLASDKSMSAVESSTPPREQPDNAGLEVDMQSQVPLSFAAAIQDRAGWLVGLLILQSMSSFIISRNEKLLQNHVVIVRFLTMLVGAGGNAGNQASVGVIRGLATGAVNDRNYRATLKRECFMGLGLATVLGISGAVRAAVFMTPLTETLAITTSLVSIVFISVVLGAVLPLAMKFCRLDPAHSSTTIQVIMDILGVTITVHVSAAILDSRFDAWIRDYFSNR